MTAEQNKTIAENGHPICPVCVQKMRVVHYTGYYDERMYWGCECDFEDLEPYVEVEDKGAYR